jgi:hypothetical protein
LRTSNDAAVSIVPPIIPYGGFSPVRLEGWLFRRDLPDTFISLSLLPAYTDRCPVCLRPSCFSVDPLKVGSVDAMYCTAMRWNAPPTPGALAPVGFTIPTIITYSAPSAPLAGTSRLRRTAVYTRGLSCAGAPRPPASGSGLSLSIPSWHATPYDPGEFDDDKFQGSNVDGAFGAKPASRHSHYSRNPLHAGHQFRGFHGSHICCGLPGCSPP